MTEMWPNMRIGRKYYVSLRAFTDPKRFQTLITVPPHHSWAEMAAGWEPVWGF